MCFYALHNLISVTNDTDSPEWPSRQHSNVISVERTAERRKWTIEILLMFRAHISKSFIQNILCFFFFTGTIAWLNEWNGGKKAFRKGQKYKSAWLFDTVLLAFDAVSMELLNPITLIYHMSQQLYEQCDIQFKWSCDTIENSHVIQFNVSSWVNISLISSQRMSCHLWNMN